MTWGLGGVAERVTQPADRGIQAVFEIDERFRRPEPLPQLLAGDELTGAIQQRLQDLKWLLGKVDPDAALSELARTQIQLEGAKANKGIQSSAHGATSCTDTQASGMLPRP